MLYGANSLTVQGRCSVVSGLCYWRSVSSLLLFTLCSARVQSDINLFIMT